jgi:hypothetical protein
MGKRIGASTPMNIDSRTIPRREPRFEVKMPVSVTGTTKDGHYYKGSGETLNESKEGMGLLLEQELHRFMDIVISISHEKRVLQIQSEVRHVTPFDSHRYLVGVKIWRKAFV